MFLTSIPTETLRRMSCGTTRGMIDAYPCTDALDVCSLAAWVDLVLTRQHTLDRPHRQVLCIQSCFKTVLAFHVFAEALHWNEFCANGDETYLG